MSDVKEVLGNYSGDITKTIEDELATITPDNLAEASVYLTRAGGKMLRPALTLITAEAVGGKRESALKAGAAIELIHTFSLIHDDIMDQDDMRRGMPSCHKAHGEAMALLAGDALLNYAYERGVRFLDTADLYETYPHIRRALEYAPDNYSRELYEKQAREIAEIQKGILAISRNEQPFDVFICYKETDSNGQRTQDSVIANDIYYQLKDAGYKVFYAAITLEGKLGSAYEPIIFAALNSAKVMLAIGTNPEYFNAVWVKNEWSRFLKIIKKNSLLRIVVLL